MENLLAFDFSMSKPAACMLYNNKYYFYSWPKIDEKLKIIFRTNGVNIIDRSEPAILKDIMQTDVRNATNLTNDIILSLKDYLPHISYVAFEGLSYASKGNVTLSLAGWRYIFQHELSSLVSLDKMYTYSPITVKSVANCAKRGMKKADMINAFIQSNISSEFRNSLEKNPELFQTKKSQAWVTHVDDLVDSYFVLKTLKVKENLK